MCAALTTCQLHSNSISPVNLLQPPSAPARGRCYYPHFTGRETEARSRQVTCLKSQNYEAAELRFKPMPPGSNPFSSPFLFSGMYVIRESKNPDQSCAP